MGSGIISEYYLKGPLLIFASICSWYSGYLFAEIIPDESLSIAVHAILKIGGKPANKSLLPKCDHWISCPPNTYAYRLLSGGGRDKFAKICFEDELLISEEKDNVARGINVAIVNYKTGKVIHTQHFDMFKGDNSGPLTEFIKNAPQKSLIFMVIHSDGSSRLKNYAKNAIEDLGSKEIKNIQFRSSWVFLGGKGIDFPADIQREKINHFDDSKNKYSDWSAEIKIEGCIPRHSS